MSKSLPKTLSYIRSEILKALAQDNNSKKGAADVKQLLPHDLLEGAASSVSTNLSVLANEKKYLRKRTMGGSKKYFLTIEGLNVAKVLEEDPTAIEIIDTRRKSTKQKEEQTEIDFDSLNVSNNAASLADGLTAVIEENRQYRELLLKIHGIIGNAIGINQNKEE